MLWRLCLRTLQKLLNLTIKNNYDSVVEEIAKSCVNYEISLTNEGFVVTLDFGVAKERNRIEKFLNAKKGGHSFYIWKDSKGKIKLSGSLIYMM